MLQTNLPDVVAEIAQAHDAYEAALAANDVAAMNQLFWDSPHTLRFGPTENLYGHAAIAGFRAANISGPARTISRRVITSFGRDFATTNIEYVRHDNGRIGRQSQSWVRTEDGWRIVAAHVSMLQE